MHSPIHIDEQSERQMRGVQPIFQQQIAITPREQAHEQDKERLFFDSACNVIVLVEN
jgi:hypothetical protein